MSTKEITFQSLESAMLDGYNMFGKYICGECRRFWVSAHVQSYAYVQGNDLFYFSLMIYLFIRLCILQDMDLPVQCRKTRQSLRIITYFKLILAYFFAKNKYPKRHYLMRLFLSC